MIEQIKMDLSPHVGRELRIKYNLGRNKFEEYNGKLKKLYDYIFIVEKNSEIKSFAYTDVIVNNVNIEFI